MGEAVPGQARICIKRIDRERDIVLIDEATGLSPNNPAESRNPTGFLQRYKLRGKQLENNRVGHYFMFRLRRGVWCLLAFPCEKDAQQGLGCALHPVGSQGGTSRQPPMKAPRKEGGLRSDLKTFVALLEVHFQAPPLHCFKHCIYFPAQLVLYYCCNITGVPT